MFRVKCGFVLKIIFLSILFCFEYQIATPFLINNQKVYDIEKVPLYNFLTKIKKVVSQDVPGKNSLDIIKEKSLESLTEQAIKDFIYIFDAFKKQKMFFYPDFELKFFKICNSFSDKLKIRDLREIKGDFEEFDVFINQYSEMHKQFLNPDELKLFEVLKRFSFFFSNFFLKKEFIDSNFSDEFWDKVFWFPVEQISQHKAIAFTTLAVALGVGGYFLWKRIMRENEKRGGIDTQNKDDSDAKAQDGLNFKGVTSGSGGKVITINKPVQLKAITQTGATCGFHAFRNVILAMLSNNKEAIEKRTMSDEKWNEWLAEMQKVAQDKSWVHGDQLRALCDPGLISLWQKYFGTNLSDVQVRALLDRIVIVDDIDRFENSQGITEKLSNSVYDFRAGSAQGILIRSSGHWFAAKIQKNVEQDSSSINVFVINSMSKNLTADPTLGRIIGLFVLREVPTSQMLEIGHILDDCNHLLTTTDVLEEGNSKLDRIIRVIGKLYDISEKVNQKNFDPQNVFKNIYGPKVKDIWNKIKNSDVANDLKSFFEQNLIQLVD